MLCCIEIKKILLEKKQKVWYINALLHTRESYEYQWIFKPDPPVPPKPARPRVATLSAFAKTVFLNSQQFSSRVQFFIESRGLGKMVFWDSLQFSSTITDKFSYTTFSFHKIVIE